MENLHELADEIAAIEQRVSDAIVETLRDQLHGDVAARERDRQLSRVRRSLARAESLLRAADSDED